MQSVARQSLRSRVRYPAQPHTFVTSSADSRRVVASYWQRYMHPIFVNRFGGLSLAKNIVVLTIAVYRKRKTTQQHFFAKQCINWLVVLSQYRAVPRERGKNSR